MVADPLRRVAEFEREAEASIGSWSPLDITSVLARADEQDPEPGLLFRSDGIGLFYPGEVNSMFGETTAGKTMLARFVVAERLLAGERTGWVEFEDQPRKLVRYLRLMGVSDPAIVDHLTILHPRHAYRRDEALASIEGTDLWIVDAVAPAMANENLDEDKNSEVERWLNLLPADATEMGATVLLLDNVTKAKDARGKFQRGGARKLDAIEGAAYLVEALEHPAPGHVGRSVLKMAKDRNAVVSGLTGSVKDLDAVALAHIDGTDPHRLVLRVEPPPDGFNGVRESKASAKDRVYAVAPVQDIAAVDVKMLHLVVNEDGGKPLTFDTVRRAASDLEREGLFDRSAGEAGSAYLYWRS
jgi:hypothetical protein